MRWISHNIYSNGLPSTAPMAAALPRRSTDRAHSHRLRRFRLHHLLLLPLVALLLLASLSASAAVLGRANFLGRSCLPSASASASVVTRPRLAMVSLSDEGASPAVARRSFRGVMAAAGGNKRAYAAAHGYDFAVHDTAAIDRRRPPSWSKILAVRARLPRYNWVFWNDADTVVTNPDISLERILLSVIGHNDFNASPDLVVTKDFNGVNSGVFFIRRSEWSERFLETWWNQTSFVRFGSTKSGDNAALKHLIDHLSPEEMQAHVRVSQMQCLFNSYPWLPTWKSVFRLIFAPSTTWKGVYSDGDFMIHFAGLDDKSGWTAKILEGIRAPHVASSAPSSSPGAGGCRAGGNNARPHVHGVEPVRQPPVVWCRLRQRINF